MPVTSDKDEIIRRVMEYLKFNKEIDLKVFLLDDNWDWSRITPDLVSIIANKMRQSGKYNFKPEGIGDMFTYIISKKESRLLHDFKVGLITAGFSLLVGWLLLRADNRETIRQNKKQDEQLIRLSDSLRNLQKNVNDSLAVLRKLGKPIVINRQPPNP